jgi:2'-hydroxyisoflavone reductase
MRQEHLASQANEQKSSPLRILILGGTGIIGPHHVRAAIDRGHSVSIFNRGRRVAMLPESVEQLIGDRAGDLDSIANRDWDAVIDLPTTLPNWVRKAGEVLAQRAKHYTFISSLAVYTGAGAGLLNEDSPLWEYEGAADPFSLVAFDLSLYGPLKVLSEREAERNFPSRSLIIRPGFIVGPGDETDRFTYWPVRMSQGGEVLAPGAPLDPAQLIDARDLAEWVIRMVERGETGAYNATGPAMPMSICEMLGGIRGISSVPLKLTWVASDWLQQQRVTPQDLPMWSPPPFDIGMRADVRRAVDKGLTFRTLASTATETLAWHQARPASRHAPHSGWTLKRERDALMSWRRR